MWKMVCTTEQSRREDRLGAGDQTGAFTPTTVGVSKGKPQP